MNTLCGANCNECSIKSNCKGCIETDGKPFGGSCVAAEYIRVGGISAFTEFKNTIMSEVNALNIKGMPEITKLNCLCGSYVNLEYPLTNGEKVKFLDDKKIYLGTQVECEFGGDRCFGLVCDSNFILVCTYCENGTNPEIVVYKKR